MKTHIITAATTIALIAGIGVAWAAEHGSAISRMSQPSAMREMTRPGLSLTADQQRLAWKDVGRNATAQRAPGGFIPRVGAMVPNDVNLTPVPASLGRQVGALSSYDYALMEHKLLIVNPSNKKVVDVIGRHA